MNNNYNIIKLDQVESTNDFAKEIINSKIIDDFTIVYTDNQTKGKGQRGNLWKSKAYKNLTFSLIIKPNIKVEKQSYISKIVSLALLDYFDNISDYASIKWPNDIYINNKKIAGILIENIIQSNKLNYSIIGIGININQTKFDDDLPNPISLKQITKQDYNLENILNEIIYKLKDFFTLKDNYKLIDNLYNKRLYGLKTQMEFIDNKGLHFKAEILGTDELGKLKLKTANKTTFYSFNEIKTVTV